MLRVAIAIVALAGFVQAQACPSLPSSPSIGTTTAYNVTTSLTNPDATQYDTYPSAVTYWQLGLPEPVPVAVPLWTCGTTQGPLVNRWEVMAPPIIQKTIVGPGVPFNLTIPNDPTLIGAQLRLQPVIFVAGGGNPTFPFFCPAGSFASLTACPRQITIQP